MVWTLETADRERETVVIESFDPATGWRVRDPAGGEPRTIPLDALRRFSRPAQAPRLAARPGWQAILDNGDRISGVEVMLNDKNLCLAGTPSGALTIPRERVRGLRRLDAWPVYEGPRLGETWNGAPNPLIAEEFLLRLPAGASLNQRFRELPRRLHIRVNTAPVVDFTLRLPAGDPVRNDADYVLQRAAGQWTLSRQVPGAEPLVIEKDKLRAIPDAAGAAEAQWDVFTDMEKRRVWLFCDGQLVCAWQEDTDEDTPPVSAAGDSVAVHAAKTTFDIRLFQLAPWRSSWPAPEHSDGPLAQDADALLLANGDLIQGEVRSIQGGKLVLQTSTLPLTLPAARIAALNLRGKAGAETPAPAGFLRAKFINGDQFTFKPTGIAGGDLAGEHPTFGPCRAALADLRLLEQQSDAAAP